MTSEGETAYSNSSSQLLKRDITSRPTVAPPLAFLSTPSSSSLANQGGTYFFDDTAGYGQTIYVLDGAITLEPPVLPKVIDL